MQTVVVLGASSDASRYSHMAMEELLARGHRAVPVHPREKVVCGVPVLASLSEVPASSPLTLTMYVGPALSQKMTAEILALRASRVIFNPGSENEELMAKLRAQGAEVLEACTLVMLRTGQF